MKINNFALQLIGVLYNFTKIANIYLNVKLRNA